MASPFRFRDASVWEEKGWLVSVSQRVKKDCRRAAASDRGEEEVLCVESMPPKLDWITPIRFGLIRLMCIVLNLRSD